MWITDALQFVSFRLLFYAAQIRTYLVGGIWLGPIWLGLAGYGRFVLCCYYSLETVSRIFLPGTSLLANLNLQPLPLRYVITPLYFLAHIYIQGVSSEEEHKVQPYDALSAVQFLQNVLEVPRDLVHAAAANGLAW